MTTHYTEYIKLIDKKYMALNILYKRSNKLVSYCTSFFFVFSLCLSNVTAQKTTGTMLFAGVEMVYNDHVGNEWSYYVTLNGTELKEGKTQGFRGDISQEIVLKCVLQETEETYNDSASKVIRLTFGELLSYKGSGFFVPVTITESNGRYAGNSAKMKFLFYVE